MSEVTGISRTSIQRILKHYKWHPYKIQLLHELNEDDHDRRLQFCEIIKLEYGVLIWYPYYATHISQIERVQRKFLKYLELVYSLSEDLTILYFLVRPTLFL
nr:unnamed protein product [Callosobruchus chinensis]